MILNTNISSVENPLYNMNIQIFFDNPQTIFFDNPQTIKKWNV